MAQGRPLRILRVISRLNVGVPARDAILLTERFRKAGWVALAGILILGGMIFLGAGPRFAWVSTAADPTRAPLALGDGPHLFVDDFLIARSDNLARLTRHPFRLSEPVVRKEQTAFPQTDGGRVFWPMLIYDKERDLFRMWHMVYAPGGLTHVVYRESKDPRKWEGDGRMVFTVRKGFATTILDNGPNHPQPSRRFVMGYYTVENHGLSVAFSPDGIRWTPYPGNPVFPALPPGSGDARWLLGPSDIIDFYRDPIRGRVGAFVKMYSGGEFGLQSKTMDPGWGIRLSGHTCTRDLIRWEKPRRVFVPGPGDQGATEFYGASVIARGDLLLAFVRILRDDLPATPGGPVEGIGYTVLATSRDGRRWRRYKEPFLDRNPASGAFDHAMAWVTSVTERRDLMYFAYSGYNRGHKTGDRQIGISTLPKDRFVSRSSVGEKRGSLETPLLRSREGKFAGLWLNADARKGEIRVRLKGPRGRVIPGFSFRDCRPLRRNQLATPLRCKGAPEKLAGKSFRVEFSLGNAHLYGFSFSGPR